MKNSNKNKILLYIFISILLILLYCVFTPYKNKYTIIQNENLTNPSNNNTYCSSLQGQPGVTYKECLPGDTSCIQGQQCSICTSSRTNISCTGIPCITDVDCADHGGKCSNGKCIQPSPPSSSCKTDSDCGSGMICQNGKCVSSGGSGIPFNNQPSNTVQLINNTSETPLYIYVEYGNKNLDGNGNPQLVPPSSKWKKISGKGEIADPVDYMPIGNAQKCINNVCYNNDGTKMVNPNDVGSATWQVVTLSKKGDSILLSIPNFPKPQAWSIRPLKYQNGKPCGGGAERDDCGMPILIESGKDMVGDMSAVDGVNFLVRYEFTTKDGNSLIDFNTNPCKAVGLNPKGCRNPSVDGIFKSSIVNSSNCKPGPPHCWLSNPCPAGTCNLDGISKQWCDTIHKGQCANSSTTWTGQDRSPACVNKKEYTTYCYSHDDANSSPWFSSPYKMKVTYSDLE